MADTIIKKDILSAEVVRLLDKKTVLRGYANTKYEGVIKKQGDTVTVQTFPNITLGTVTPGGDITDQDFTITGENLTANVSKGARISIRDIDEAISNLDLHSQVADRIAYALADEYDQAIAGQYTNALAANKLDDGDLATATNSGTGNPAILSKTNVYEAIAAMKKALSDNNAGDDAAVFINPAVTKLLVEAGYSTGADAGYKDGSKGFVAMVAGMKVYETNNLVTATGSTYIMAFDRNTVHMADKLTQIKVATAQAGFYDNVLVETTYGTKVFAENSKRMATFEVTNA